MDGGTWMSKAKPSQNTRFIFMGRHNCPPPRDRGGYWAVGMPLAPRRFPSGGRAQVFSTQSPPRRKDIRRWLLRTGRALRWAASWLAVPIRPRNRTTRTTPQYPWCEHTHRLRWRLMSPVTALRPPWQRCQTSKRSSEHEGKPNLHCGTVLKVDRLDKNNVRSDALGVETSYNRGRASLAGDSSAHCRGQYGATLWIRRRGTLPGTTRWSCQYVAWVLEQHAPEWAAGTQQQDGILFCDACLFLGAIAERCRGHPWRDCRWKRLPTQWAEWIGARWSRDWLHCWGLSHALTAAL